ncbi:CRISPR-associated protein Csx3 [Chamaesiphon polymorphus]|uniref:CRISPR-associated protein Csx3 n=1 Tax=Chamaesiphon polymorphus CCALA 037 TaxID=2107692 RepID=A0A2T1GLK7_9CYAN|nr:CRISPR-associated protein Csx3 [Chamaesiphon polymorphus]PSB58758.1 CRISPR-associated protein Csx3 [Chamaesiphon polymorphus CCALA 037]
MSAYNIEICDDTLTVSFGEPANNDRIVIEVSAKIDRLIKSKQIRGGKLLKITGRQSIPVAYTICHQVAHLYGAIAIFDPKIGGKGIDAYIVVISHSPGYQVGQILTDPNNLNVSPLKTC